MRRTRIPLLLHPVGVLANLASASTIYVNCCGAKVGRDPIGAVSEGKVHWIPKRNSIFKKLCSSMKEQEAARVILHRNVMMHVE